MPDAFKVAEGYVEIETRYDGKTISRMSTRAGDQASRSFASAFGSRTSTRRFNRLWGTFFKPLNNLKRWLTRARLPALLGGIFGAVLTGIPTIGHLTSAVGVGMIPAMLSWGSTIGIVRALLGDLSKSIKSQVLKQLNNASDAIKELAQETAKPGLNAFLEEALTHLPILNKYVKALAGHVSDVGFSMAKLLDDQKNIERIKTTLEGTAEATGKWYSLLDEAAEVILVLAAAGTPLFQRFTDSMLRVGHTVHDWILLQEATGALQRHLEDSYETLEKLGRAGRDFLIGLFNIINGGVFGTEKVADSLERWGAAFREWTTHTENIEKVRKVISWFTEHVGQFFRFAAAATAVSLAITAISKAKAPIAFVRTLVALGPLGFILTGIGAVLASMAAGFVLAYTRSEEFRQKVSDLVKMVSTRLAPILKDWYEWVKSDLLPLMDDLAMKGIAKITEELDKLLTKIEQNQDGLKELRPLFLALAWAGSFLAKGLIEEVAGAVGQVITVLGWLGKAVKVAREAFNFLKRWAGDAVDYVAEKFGELKHWAGDAVDSTARFFRALPGKVAEYLKSLPKRVAESLLLAMEGGAYIIGVGLGKIVDFFVRLPGRVITQLDTLWELMKRAVRNIIVKTVEFFSTLPAKVTSWVEKTWKSVKETTARWFTNIIDFIKRLPDRVLTALINLPNVVISRFSDSWKRGKKETENRVRDIVEFIAKFPGRAFSALAKLRERLVTRFAEGWAKATGTQKEKVKAIIDHVLGIPGRVFNALRALAGRLASRAREGWQAFRDAASAKVQSFLNWVFDIPDRIMRALGGMKTLLLQRGKDAIQGLWDGMTSVWERVKTWVGSLGGRIKALKGPLAVDKTLLVAEGKAIMEGLGTGLFFGSKGPLSFVSGMAGNIKKMLSMNVSDVMFGGGGGGGGGSGSWKKAISELVRDQVAFSVSSTFRPGARTRASGNRSFHSMNRAVDITGPDMMAIWRSLLDTNPTELIYSAAPYYKSRRGWNPIGQLDPITRADHWDHVHAAYRQGLHGRGLPEDVLAMGRSGRLYGMHRGEQVLRQGETTNNSNVTHVTNNVTISASNIKEMNDVIALMKGLQSSARQHGTSARVRVA